MGYYDLLIFAACLLLHVQCQTICGKDEYTVVAANGSFISCLNCDTCHRGRGLDPPCGSRIPYPPNPDCVDCPTGKFSDELDSAPCHTCRKCAEHEIVMALCTSKSNRICNGSCEMGYFYSKKDSTHSCQKCAYCCFDGKDEEILECANQGLNASKQHCRPRPDKDCSPGSSLPSPTGRSGGTKASENGGLPNGTIAVIVTGVISTVIVALAIAICLYRTKKKQEERTMNNQSSAQNYAENGPTTESHVEPVPITTVQYSSSYTNTLTPAGSHVGLHAVTVEIQEGASDGANLNQNTANEQANQNATHSSLPGSHGNLNVPVVAAAANLDAGGNPPVRNVAADAAHPTDKVHVPVNDEAAASSGIRKLSRQFSKDSQRSGDSVDAESGRWKRSPSTSSFTETLKRRLSTKKDEPLVTNEEEDTDGSQGPITIIEEPSSQKVKEGSKVELVLKCKARGNSEVSYQWFKDGTELQGENAGTLLLKSVTLPDFGWYKCVASCKDSPSDGVESSHAELNVIPRKGTIYKCLNDTDLHTQDRIEILLTQKSCGLGGWRQVAFKYGMDQLIIKSLENDPEAGKKTLDYLRSSNPDLTVYEFCKILKEHSIRRLDIVKELLGHLSVPSSSNVYV